MRKTRVWLMLGCFLFAANFAAAQTRKAGLWEVTTTTTLQQPGERAGMFAAVNPNASPSTNAEPLPMCLTQTLIDTYGIALPPSLKDCQISNIVKKAARVTADMTCKGRFNGKGSIESTWTDEEHGTGTVHFIGKIKEGTNYLTMGWTQSVTAVFKSADCGGVKPRTVPAK